jgi:hypothetical protein
MIEPLGLIARDIAVAHGTNIKAKLTWKNVNIPSGTSLVAVFFLGKGGVRATYTFPVWPFSEHYIGSLAEVSAPAIGFTTTTIIPSNAHFMLEDEDPTVWDAQAIIGLRTQTIGTLSLSDSGRIVGLMKSDIDAGYLVIYGQKWYTGVLSVSSAPAAAQAEITGFEFVEG